MAKGVQNQTLLWEALFYLFVKNWNMAGVQLYRYTFVLVERVLCGSVDQGWCSSNHSGAEQTRSGVRAVRSGGCFEVRRWV